MNLLGRVRKTGAWPALLALVAVLCLAAHPLVHVHHAPSSDGSGYAASCGAAGHAGHDGSLSRATSSPARCWLCVLLHATALPADPRPAAALALADPPSPFASEVLPRAAVAVAPWSPRGPPSA